MAVALSYKLFHIPTDDYQIGEGDDARMAVATADNNLLQRYSLIKSIPKVPKDMRLVCYQEGDDETETTV